LKWWELANEMLNETTIETRFVLSEEGRVAIHPDTLPKDEDETKRLFEIASKALRLATKRNDER